uniref:Uncharacterized protein n=1 Tax=Anguilla anguilla TaxID=7936 RepID=A0A0E9T2A0_ANGAN
MLSNAVFDCRLFENRLTQFNLLHWE